MGPIVKRRKLDKFRAPAVEELTFDPSARSEYLTGFSKRKQARKDHARETAVKLAKEERIRDRKQLREQRKADLELHVSEINNELKKQNALMRGEDPNSDSGEEVFEGFDAPVNPAEELPDDAEYVDEDKYTTVTVEAMDNSADDEEPADVVGVPGKAADAATRKDEVEKKKRPWAKGKDGEDKKRVKKKKFRYESKAERSLTRQKQKSKSSAAAKARRKT